MSDQLRGKSRSATSITNLLARLYNYKNLQAPVLPHLLTADGTPKGYVAAERLRPIESGQHRVTCKMNELNVRGQANAMSEIIGKLALLFEAWLYQNDPP